MTDDIRTFTFHGHKVEILREPDGEFIWAIFIDDEFVESGYAGPCMAEAAAQRFIETELPTLDNQTLQHMPKVRVYRQRLSHDVIRARRWLSREGIVD
jgi:hypothetical protein